MFEVITMDSKSKRDDMFRKYQVFGNEFEKQVVKFSGHRPLMATVENLKADPSELLLDSKGRVRYTCTWSIAYPTERIE